eukprot:scaffold40890_cov66-Phaeocystis_antarctica.AAC.2
MALLNTSTMALLTLLLAELRGDLGARVLGLTRGVVEVDRDSAVYDHEEVRALTPLPCTRRAHTCRAHAMYK